MTKTLRRVPPCAFFVLVVAAGCNAPAKPAPAKVSVRATTTRGTPAEGVEILLSGAVLARSDATGRATVDVGGREGDAFELQIKCPAPLRSPATPLVVRRLAIAGGDVEHAVRCEETRRTLSVVIRAEGGPDLPILYLGKEIGRTDASGAGAVKIEADVKDRIELTLGTDGTSMADAHPKNPSATFEPAEKDEVKEFAVTFTRDAKRKPKVAAPKGPVPF